MNSQIEKLFSLKGKFTGNGINHEGQNFVGTFEVKEPYLKKGLAFSFCAVGENKTNYHSESSLIGMSMKGTPALWISSSNHPGVFERELKSEKILPGGETEFIFSFGKREDRNTFREEIRVLLNPDQSLTYTYFWGMPGGDFAERSGCQMYLS